MWRMLSNKTGFTDRGTCRDQLDMSMPVAAAANEQYKAAIEKGHADDDFAAVYNAVSKK